MDAWETARRIVSRYRLHADAVAGLEHDIAEAIEAARVEGPPRPTIEPLTLPDPPLPFEPPDAS
jgi:hypothetical protein